MGHQALQIVLEGRADRCHRQALLDRLEHLNVVAHQDVGLTRDEQLHAVDLRAAHLDGDVEALLLIEACCLRLVEAAVLGLGQPAGQERDFIGRGSLCAQPQPELNSCQQRKPEPCRG